MRSRVENDLKYSQVCPTRLKPNPWNSNKLSPDAEEKLEQSIHRFGLYRPIVVRQVRGSRKLEIVGGQHRWEIAKKLKIKKVPIVNLGNVSDVVSKEIGLVDNARYGQDDSELLNNIIKDLVNNTSKEDLTSFLPMTNEDITSLIEIEEIDFDMLDPDDDEVNLDAEPDVQHAPSHQIMRFKVHVRDAEAVTEYIEKIMTREGYAGPDHLMNAGDALVQIVKEGAS